MNSIANTQRCTFMTLVGIVVGIKGLILKFQLWVGDPSVLAWGPNGD